MKTINLKGKQYATFNSVLDEAHKQGLECIATSLLQAPTKESPVCIVQAKVKTSKGEYNGIGDAAPSNVGKMIVPHLIRMAETRAIGRALRFATNAPTLAEELGDEPATAKEPQPVATNGSAPVESLNRIEQHMEENEQAVNRFMRNKGLIGADGTWRDAEPDTHVKIGQEPKRFFDAVQQFAK
tara:strand:- start:150 stop:701 length:552 start_codon:yes stop_codon:yes gene_type:complete